MSWLMEPEGVVGISFVLFIALLAYFGVHKLIGSKLDERAERIREELDEARRLREEAQKTFAEFERQRGEVEGQAEEIIEHARAESEQAAEKAKDELQDSIARRLRAAEEQIAMAEAGAVKEIKDKAVQVAIAAAAEVMQARLTGERANDLVDEAITEVGKRLN